MKIIKRMHQKHIKQLEEIDQMDLKIHGLSDEFDTEKAQNIRLSDDISQIQKALDVN